MGGGTDLLPQLQRGIRPAGEVVDLRAAVPAGIDAAGDGLRIGAATRVADVARDPDVRARFAVLAQAAAAVGLAAAARDGHRRPATCARRCAAGTSAIPTSTAGCAAATPATPRSATTASTASSRATASRSRRPTWRPRCSRWTRVVTTNRREALPARRPLPQGERRRPLDARARAGRADHRGDGAARRRTRARTCAPASGRRGASPCAAVAAARFDDGIRLAAIGVSNLPRLLDPADPLAGLPGLEMTGWKRRLLQALAADALAAVA